MHYTELYTLWQHIFQNLGFRETKDNNWVFEGPGLIIVLSFKINTQEKDFYIDIGIIVKKLHNDHTLKEPVLEDNDIGQGLYNILLDLGELEYYLNNLFCYDPDINTDDEVIDNSREIARLFITKVIPYIKQIDAYTWLAKDFEEATTWKPLLHYFRPSPDLDMYFHGALEKYYRQP